MPKIDLSNVSLPQEEVTVDDKEYLLTALPATEGLQFLEQHIESIDSGKPDLAVMKKIICKTVSVDGRMFSDKPNKDGLSFDIYFARKLGHMRNLFTAVLEYNFGDVFTEAASEE